MQQHKQDDIDTFSLIQPQLLSFKLPQQSTVNWACCDVVSSLQDSSGFHKLRYVHDKKPTILAVYVRGLGQGCC